LHLRIPEVANRVWVVVQDAQGNQLLPMEAEAPFLTVSDGGLTITWTPGATGLAVYAVNVRAYVQDLRDVETPVIGHAAGNAQGVADLQGLITAALNNNLLASRITGIENATALRETQVDVVADESWWAVIGDVAVEYHMTES
jgi:hypothetical protein